jgi:hypothetical protein
MIRRIKPRHPLDDLSTKLVSHLTELNGVTGVQVRSLTSLHGKISSIAGTLLAMREDRQVHSRLNHASRAGEQLQCHLKAGKPLPMPCENYREAIRQLGLVCRDFIDDMNMEGTR